MPKVKYISSQNEIPAGQKYVLVMYGEEYAIKVLYEDKAKGEMTCPLKWDPGATLPMHKHPEIEQTWVLEGSFYDHDGICRAGEFVWRHAGSFHQTHSEPQRSTMRRGKTSNILTLR